MPIMATPGHVNGASFEMEITANRLPSLETPFSTQMPTDQDGAVCGAMSRMIRRALVSELSFHVTRIWMTLAIAGSVTQASNFQMDYAFWDPEGKHSPSGFIISQKYRGRFALAMAGGG